MSRRTIKLHRLYVNKSRSNAKIKIEKEEYARKTKYLVRGAQRKPLVSKIYCSNIYKQYKTRNFLETIC